MKVVLLIFVLALAMGCVGPTPIPPATTGPTITPKPPYLAFQLDVKIDPTEGATYLLNPKPLGKGGYAQGMIVTIDLLLNPGWEVDKWVGPVFKQDGTTAQIQMDSSWEVAVRLKSTTPPAAKQPAAKPPAAKPLTATPTPTPQEVFQPLKERFHVWKSRWIEDYGEPPILLEERILNNHKKISLPMCGIVDAEGGLGFGGFQHKDSLSGPPHSSTFRAA